MKKLNKFLLFFVLALFLNLFVSAGAVHAAANITVSWDYINSIPAYAFGSSADTISPPGGKVLLFDGNFTATGVPNQWVINVTIPQGMYGNILLLLKDPGDQWSGVGANFKYLYSSVNVPNNGQANTVTLSGTITFTGCGNTVGDIKVQVYGGPYDGLCGYANGVPASSLTTSSYGLCNYGTVASVNKGTNWSWACQSSLINSNNRPNVITFNATPGIFSFNNANSWSRYVFPGTSLGVLPDNPTYGGYYFCGWYTSKDYGATLLNLFTTSTPIFIDGNRGQNVGSSVYAKWSTTPCTDTWHTGIAVTTGPTCSAPIVTDGVCDISTNLIPTYSAPTSLCSTGVASAVSQVGNNWTWSCVGSKTTKNCSAPVIIDAQCGSIATSYSFVYNNAPYYPLNGTGWINGTSPSSTSVYPYVCSAGALTSVTVYGAAGSGYPNGGAGSPYGPWGWCCPGANGGVKICCYALAKTSINGKCGPINNAPVTLVPTTGLCWSGNSTAVLDKNNVTNGPTSPWTWTCTGINGGTTDSSCLAPSPVVISPSISPGPFTPHYCTPAVELAWTYSNTNNNPQKYYQIKIFDNNAQWTSDAVGYSKAGGNIIYAPDKVPSSSFDLTLNFSDANLSFGSKTYKWEVQVWDSLGNSSSFLNGGSFTTPAFAYPYVEFDQEKLTATIINNSATINFNDESNCSSPTYNYPCTYSWNFGDNKTCTSSNNNGNCVSHIYSNLQNVSTKKDVTLKLCDNTTPTAQCCSVTHQVQLNKSTNTPTWKEINPFQ